MNKTPSEFIGIKPGHDGAIVCISNGTLKFSYEAEKDSHPRYSELTPEDLLKALSFCGKIPDVIASGGWSKGHDPNAESIEAGYLGLHPGTVSTRKIFGQDILHFSSSHERSHILCAYGLSPFQQGQPCYALTWEGHIGSFYYINEEVAISKIADILPSPGIRYAFLYALADPSFRMGKGAIRLSDAGKLMALAAYATDKPYDADAHRVIEKILDPNLSIQNLCKDDYLWSQYHNCGITNQDFVNLAKNLSDRIFQIYFESIKTKISKRLPLLISGGCGLNCDWNSKWIDSSIFSDVFIPPCTNDSGSALGTAIDAMLYLTGKAKINWNIYAGEEPVADVQTSDDFAEYPYSPKHTAEILHNGKILGWMRGRYEIGPRSLGARSILASPAKSSMLSRLNRIKNREDFRPIAPICIEEDMQKYFHPSMPSPYMLEFRDVISDLIPAVTHVDKSARPQSISKKQNADLYQLLSEFKKLSNISVLCNTSLNFNGKGFINKLSDIQKFSLQCGLDGFVFENRIFLKK